jgi:cation/acetate symporter
VNIDPWILTFSALTVVATIWMGFWSARRSKTAHDFFVAGRSVSVGWNASAISGEYLSAASFMGVAGMVMSSGYDTLWYPVCYACGYLFLLLFIAGPLRRFGAYTIPDFAEGRFDSPLFRKIAVTFVLFIGFFYTMPQMKGAGTTLAYIFPGMPYWGGVLLVGAVITLNVALGGMKGITLVQAFQYWLKMFAISVPVFVLMAVYGHYGKQVGKNGSHSDLILKPGVEYRPAHTPQTNEAPVAFWKHRLVSLLPESYARKITQTQADQWGLGDTVGTMYSSPTIQLHSLLGIYGSATSKKILIAGVSQQEAVERRLAYTTNHVFGSVMLDIVTEVLRTNGVVLVSEDSHEVRFAAADVLMPAVGFRPPLPAKAPRDETWLNPFGPLTTKAAQAAGLSAQEGRPFSLLYTYSLIIALVCGTAGLPHILVRFYTNPDGVAAKRTTMWVMILIGVFYLFPPIFGVMGRNLLPELYAAAGAKGTDKIVLELPRILNEKVPKLGSIMSGITCAGAFAAFMSTFSGLLVSITGALAHDIYGRILRPRSTPDQRMKAFKVFAVVGGACAILLGFLVENFEINKLVGWAFAIAATSYFPLLFLSTWWRRITMKGAATGMLVGGTLSLIAIATTMLADQAKWAAGLKAWYAHHPLERTLAEQPAIWALPLAIVLMLVISKLTQRSVPADIRMKMLVLHAPEKLGLKQEYIQEHQGGH